MAAASKPGKPAPKSSGTKGKKASSGGPAKGPTGKAASKAAAPRVKPSPPPSAPRNSGGGHIAPQQGSIGRGTAAAQPAYAPCKLPRPTAATVVTLAGATAATATATATATTSDMPTASQSTGGPAAVTASSSGARPTPWGSHTQRTEPLPALAAEGDSDNDNGTDSNNGDDDDDVGSDGFLLPDDNLGDSPAAARAAQGDSEGGGPSEGGLDATDGAEDGEYFPEIQLNLPPPTLVKVKEAKYLQSCVSVSGCPAPRYPEFAVIGRSNVGKSSLINMITGRKELALVSKQPGKTKCINHFVINDSWYLVDLPGYGFAKIGLEGRQQFDSFTREYFKQRPNLAMVLLLVDASIPPQRIDLEYANWLTDNEVPFTLVFTKADKRRKGLSASVRDSHVIAFKRALLQDLAFLPPSLLTSAAKGLGRGELLSFIASLRAAYEQSGRLEAIRRGML